MPIYRLKLAGRRKSILVKAESAAKAKELVVTVKALNAEEMQEAIESDEKLWKAGDELPADTPEAADTEAK